MMNIPCCVDKNGEDGNFCKSSDAKLCDINTNIARTITCKEPGLSVHHSNLCIVRGGQMYSDRYIVAMRGRNPEHPTSRESGLPTEQRLEVNKENVSNTLTTVQKDNLVMEKLMIKQATKDGYIEMEDGGVFDASFPSSSTRRGRVQEGGTVSPTLTAQNNELYRVENYRIRKLTPLECFRLMGVDDEDAGKMIAVNSNTQCYKQAGNSIVVDVMAAMFRRLF